MSPEYESSWEHLSNEERRKKIAAHISAMHIGHRVLEESHAQQEAIQDFEARSYQLDAFNALWTARRDGADRGLIHLATGLGKTSVAVVDYAAFRQEQLEKTGLEPRALFVVHQNNILEQASERFAELLPEASRSSYSNRHKNLPDSGVTFASFQTLTNGAHRFPDNYFDYIIYDEAHHIEAKTYKKVVEHFKPKFQLGLTATPERMDEKDITDHFGKALYTKTLPEAIAEKHLATVNYNIVFDDAVKEAMRNGFEPSSLAEIQRLFEVQPRNEVIVEKIRDAQELIRQEQNVERVKTIIFCADLEHADAIADMMDGESYHSGKDEKQQAALLDAFRGDGLEIITVRDMFNEGVDIPDARLIVFLRTTQSATIFEQQLGRGLRKNKDKQEVTILDFVANIERIALIKELVKNIDTVRPPRGSGTKGSGNTEGVVVCEPDENIRVHGDDSEFVFTQEMIDLLEKFAFLSQKSEISSNWRNLSDEALVTLAKSFHQEEELSYRRIDELSKLGLFPSTKYIRDRYGSVGEFLLACDIKIRKPNWNEWSREEIIELALSLSPNLPLTSPAIEALAREGEFPGVHSLLNKFEFSSIKDFQRVCGFEVKEIINWDELNDDELVALAKNISPNGYLTVTRMQELSSKGEFPYYGYIMKRFGSLIDFHSACGFELYEWKNMTNDEIVAVALKISPDKALITSQIAALSKQNKLPSVSYIVKRFGSTPSFQRACGFEIVDWASMSDEALIEKAKQISPNKPLTSTDLTELSRTKQFIGVNGVIKRFGSMNNFKSYWQ